MKVTTSWLSGRPQYRLLFLRCLLAIAWIAPAGLYHPLRAQQPVHVPGRERPAILQGRVTDSEGKPVAGASLAVVDTRLGTTAGEEGRFRLEVPAGRLLLLTVTALGYQPRQVPVQGEPGKVQPLDLVLLPQIVALQGVDVKAGQGLEGRGEAGVVKVDPKQVQYLPSPFGDFNKTLATLPGVVSNNELSSTYSVRGGSFDENLVYVNGIEVYRPFLVRSGQQEGLSFINPDLVSGITFSSGGWQPKYGDKLSSVLNIDYKQPAGLGGSVTAGLLGGAAHLEAGSKNGRVAFLGGVRQKCSQYLLNSLEVKGEYLPRFTDAQGYLHADLSKEKSAAGLPRTELGVLFSYARNRYFTQPTDRRSTFGTLTRLQQLLVVFSGEESLEYDMYQGGLKLTKRPGDRLTLHLIASAMQTTEREDANVDGTYRLCDLNGQACTGTVDLGSQLQYVKNRLGAGVVAAENRSEWILNTRHALEWGAKVSGERIRDDLNEFLLIDSAGNTRITDQLRTGFDLNTGRFSAYGQHTFAPNNAHRFTYGARLGYWTLNRQWLVSPSVQYTFRPAWRKEVLFKMAAGVYRQPPFYRELRDRAGVLNAGLKAQSSFHLVAGAERRIQLWSRDFVLNAEAYYKNLWDVVAYDVENIRLRYYANNDARAYATGLDFRMSGEFVKGAESWFSVGVLNTRENLGFDARGYVRRPTDQRVTAAVFFQDHLPRNPTLRVYLNAVYGTGLPFGPPRDPRYRAALQAPAYHRVDIGFSKILELTLGKGEAGNHSLWLGAEVLNLLGNRNVISYTWITDVEQRQFAVPNTLSARFVNLKAILRLGHD